MITGVFISMFLWVFAVVQAPAWCESVGEKPVMEYRQAAETPHRADAPSEAAEKCNFSVSYDRTERPPDIKQAVKANRAAAEQGFADAQFNLATMYENGCEVKKDE